jgi:hypothetical protein
MTDCLVLATRDVLGASSTLRDMLVNGKPDAPPQATNPTSCCKRETQGFSSTRMSKNEEQHGCLKLRLLLAAVVEVARFAGTEV